MKQLDEFRKLITRGKLVHFKSTIDARKSRTGMIQFITLIFVKKVFFSKLRKNRCIEA